MRRFILFTTSSLLLIATLALGQTTTIRDGASPGVADVLGSATTGTEQGVVVRCASGCGGTGATTPSDAFANPTDATDAASFLFGFNGTTWDRLRVDGSKNLNVNLNALGFGALPVTGTFWQSTQPVSCANCSGTVTISGTVTSNQGTPASTANRWPVQITDGTHLAQVSAAGSVQVDGSGVTQPVSCANCSGTVTVSGTVTANQGTANATPWNQNTAQIAGASTATAASGVQKVGVVGGTGTSLETTAGVLDHNVKNIGNAAVSTAASGVQKVGIVGSTGTAMDSTAGILDTNLKNVGGSAVSTAATGVAKVGVVGNAGAAVDAANNAAVPANVLALGCETISQGSQPTAATTGNMRRQLCSVEGVLFVQEGGSNKFSCQVNAVTATTQCQAAPAAGLRAYITSVSLSNQAATVQTLIVGSGTGTNCGTTFNALTHAFQFGTNATTTSPQEISSPFPTPLVPAAAQQLCVKPSAATSFGATLTGYIAP